MADAREVIQLPNGARIVFDTMPNLRTSAVGVFLAAGARHESDERNGLAHFLEHMAFKSAAGRNAREIAEAVEARGGVMNASTGYELTNYFVRCLSPDAPEMLDVALSLAFGPDHPLDEIEREKGVVRQEIGEAADQPDDLVFELAQVASYPGHALGRPILGTEQTLDTIRRDDLVGFAANYSPQRTVVSVAGAFDRDAVLSVVNRWLAARNGEPAPTSTAPVLSVAALRVEQRKLEQSHLVLARRTVSATSPDRFAARIFAEIFGGGMASRLFQDVREARGLAYTIDASCDQHSDCGRISVYAGSDPKDAAEVVKITSDIWGDMATAGPTESELARAKAVAAAQFAMSAEAPAARAGSAAYELLTFDRLVSVEEVLGHIDNVTIADVRRVAAETLSNPGIASAVGPKAGLAAAEAFVSA
ncbi:MAG TPA: pitrilysin family protein [Hyphomonadaceae bacterium]|nr:pitrilysin family protein [Hyphomonadaceae bacterium]HPI49530.1 pitrilysin family protein [Hyphomonadaceae bacterium]